MAKKIEIPDSVKKIFKVLGSKGKGRKLIKYFKNDVPKNLTVDEIKILHFLESKISKCIEPKNALTLLRGIRESHGKPHPKDTVF